MTTTHTDRGREDRERSARARLAEMAGELAREHGSVRVADWLIGAAVAQLKRVMGVDTVALHLATVAPRVVDVTADATHDAGQLQ
jgi:hypothetical protein